MWQLYMIRCGDGSLYTGITTDVPRRLGEHTAGNGAAAGPYDFCERFGDVALEGEFVLALELHLAGSRAGGERLGKGCAVEEDAAGVIDDGNAAVVEALDGVGDEVGDAADLLVVEAGAGLELEEDAGGGLGLVFLEDGFLWHGDVDAAGADAAERIDGAGELAFEAAAEVDLLDEVGCAEVGMVEDFEADGAALGEACLGEADADFGHLVGGHRDGGAATAKLVLHAIAFELVGDGAAIFRSEAAEGDDHVGLGRGEEDEVEDEERGRADGAEHDLPRPRQLVPSFDERCERGALSHVRLQRIAGGHARCSGL